MARMTQKGAEVAAFARWGKHAAVQSSHRKKDGTINRTVGVIALGMFFEVKGQGKTWEEAFANADKR